MNWLATHSYIAAWASPAIVLTMQAEPHFSWLQGFVIPVLFTFFGAALGFVASQIRDELKAKRAKKSFLRAIRMELDALDDQLHATLGALNVSWPEVTSGDSPAPYFAGTLRTSVFTSQLGKVRDVDDPLIITVVHFYSDLGGLQQIVDNINDEGVEYNRAHIPIVEKESIRPRIMSGLLVLHGQILAFGKRLEGLRAKLPPAEPPI